MKVIWLTGWYPNKLSYLEGDFVQRHAKAVSLIHQVEVIHIKKDEKKLFTGNIKQEVITGNNLTERIIYYHPISTGLRFVDKILSHRRYEKLYKRAIEEYIKENGRPDLVHVYIAIKAGLMGCWIKKKYQIPFLISEQWTAYLPEAKPKLEDYTPMYRRWLKKIFSEASYLTVVSEVLGKAIQKRFNIKKYSVIPNVVNTELFYPVEKPVTPLPKFIHISVLNYQKNVLNMLEAFHLVKKSGYDFQLTVYGPEHLELRQYVIDADLTRQVIFKKEVTQDILAKNMQQADALVLYSKYETFGCVVIEANACGIPAILSDLPVFREYIIENKTGIFAAPEDPEALSKTIIGFINNKAGFNKNEIADYTRSKFSYEHVAQQFDEVYRSLIHQE